MRKNLLFIVPPCVSISELLPDPNQTFSTKIRKEIPLGALSLATYMKEYYDVEVHILDLNLKFFQLVAENKINEENNPEKYIYEYIKEIQDKEIDFCGISAIFNPTFGYIEVISRILKVIFPKAVIVAGGGVPSNLMKEVFDSAPCVDVISYGEGEVGIAGFISAENEEKYLEHSLSLITREKLAKSFTYQFEFIEDLDEIPTLDFSLIEFEKYSSHSHSQDNKKILAVPLMFSRGCPFNCCFCASHSVHGKKVRYNSLKRIKSDVEFFVKQYNINTITVWDDNFFVDKEQAIALLDFFGELKLTTEFVNGFPIYRMDDDMAKKLKEAGIDVVTLAIESGNSRVLKDIIHKPLKLEMVEKAIQCLEKYDIYTKGLFVIGFPGESLEDISVTLEFIHSTRLNWVDIFIASPLPGSELYEICVRDGYLKSTSLDACSFMQGNIETEYFTATEIEDLQVYNTTKKDFADNLDMQNKRWDRALINFEYVINGRHENPFAYYYASIAAENLGFVDKQKNYYEKYKKIRNSNREWEKLFQRFIEAGYSF